MAGQGEKQQVSISYFSVPTQHKQRQGVCTEARADAAQETSGWASSAEGRGGACAAHAAAHAPAPSAVGGLTLIGNYRKHIAGGDSLLPRIARGW